jgi:hypothetical protein
MMPKTKPTIERKLNNAELNITAEDIEFCRTSIRVYEAKAATYEAKAETAPVRKRGAYISHQKQSERARDRMAGNLAFQLEWLRRHRPAIYDEVMTE